MKIETFVKNETRKYKNKAIKNKQKGVDLDYLEKQARQHIQNCYDFIYAQHIENYSAEAGYKSMAEKRIQAVDDELFGCFNNKGNCIGFNFYR